MLSSTKPKEELQCTYFLFPIVKCAYYLAIKLKVKYLNSMSALFSAIAVRILPGTQESVFLD